jgi:hypothetical protein
MKKSRLFTEKQIKEIGTRTLDLVLEAIDAGDKDKAKELARRMYGEFQGLHDAYMFWVSGLLSHIYRRYGVDALEAAELEAHSIEGRALGRKAPGGGAGTVDFRSQVENLIGGLRGHLQTITVEEDDEKVSLTMNPCGSGQRIYARFAAEPAIGLATVEGPHAITWGKKDFPIYCVHCPVLEILAIERTGYPSPAVFPAGEVGADACHFYIYKDPEAIPEALYTRIGRKKPKRGK